MLEAINAIETHTKVKPYYLPRYFLIFTWVTSLLILTGCSITLVLYGMSLGNMSSLEWLSTIIIQLIEDAFILQPAFILASALVKALLKRPVIDDNNVLEENCRREALQRQQLLLEDAEVIKIENDEEESDSSSEVESKRRILNSAVKEILFTLVLAFFACQASNMATLSFQHTESLRKLFEVNKVIKTGAFNSTKVGLSFTKVKNSPFISAMSIF